MKFQLALVGALSSLALASSAHAATVYSAVNDFSTAANPNGVWAYGDGVAGVSFTALPNTGSQGDYSYWQDAHPVLSVPWIGTVTGAPLSTGTIFYPAGYLVEHPGPATDAIVQWTAPTAGTYSLSGSFSLLDTSPSGVIGEVFENGTEVYSGLLTGPGANQSTQTVGGSEAFSGVYTLHAGDTLSFAVNNDGNFYNDSTGLQATITAVPEPASWALMIVGLGGLGMALRNGKRKLVTA